MLGVDICLEPALPPAVQLQQASGHTSRHKTTLMLPASVIAGNAKLLKASCMSRSQCDQAAMADVCVILIGQHHSF